MKRHCRRTIRPAQCFDNYAALALRFMARRPAEGHTVGGVCIQDALSCVTTINGKAQRSILADDFAISPVGERGPSRLMDHLGDKPHAAFTQQHVRAARML